MSKVSYSLDGRLFTDESVIGPYNDDREVHIRSLKRRGVLPISRGFHYGMGGTFYNSRTD